MCVCERKRERAQIMSISFLRAGCGSQVSVPSINSSVILSLFDEGVSQLSGTNSRAQETLIGDSHIHPSPKDLMKPPSNFWKMTALWF